MRFQKVSMKERGHVGPNRSKWGPMDWWSTHFLSGLGKLRAAPGWSSQGCEPLTCLSWESHNPAPDLGFSRCWRWWQVGFGPGASSFDGVLDGFGLFCPAWTCWKTMPNGPWGEFFCAMSLSARRREGRARPGVNSPPYCQKTTHPALRF